MPTTILNNENYHLLLPIVGAIVSGMTGIVHTMFQPVEDPQNFDDDETSFSDDQNDRRPLPILIANLPSDS